MIAVIFEVIPNDRDRGTYLQLASELRSELENMDGFISIERFESLAERGKLLSLSFWRDENAVRRWRNLSSHRHAQGLGRRALFRDYRLRVASVLRDYGLRDRAEAPVDSVEALEER